MDGQRFVRIIAEAFVPFLERLGFLGNEPEISGRLYDARFTGLHHEVSVSYEPGDDVFLVLIFGRRNGRLSDVDDRSNTRRLADLNRRYMHLVTPDDRKKNEREFEGIVTRDDVERQLLKYAKELHLVLPLYLEEHGA